ncbi:MAG TPA: FAD synthase, partial [Candidatus Thalassarchaeaceae archaeon]
DDTVRKRKHEPVTGSDLRCRLVAGLKPVDDAIVGNHPNTPMYDILNIVKPDVIALGYDQEHAEERIRKDLLEQGRTEIKVCRVSGLSDDLDGTRKIIARILEMRTQKEAE